MSLQNAVDFFLHLDTYLIALVHAYGTWTYLLLFLIIFAETGLIITPFLPGDSLLFVAGSIAAQPSSPLQIIWLIGLLVIASILGNQINYAVGRCLGAKVFTSTNSWWLNKKHLIAAQHFYEKHGGKTIFLARFLPIIRTFAPFVAGASQMQRRHFMLYNIISAFVWIISLTCLGYFFGSLPIIKQNFSIVIYCIIIVTILPGLFAFIYNSISARGHS